MKYDVRLKKSVEKQLKKLDPVMRGRLTAKINLLAVDPYLRASEQMVGLPYRKLRVGTYRIVYEVRSNQLVVLIVRVGHRRDIYKRR
jgi:mRNA interferase RelE/StbE